MTADYLFPGQIDKTDEKITDILCGRENFYLTDLPEEFFETEPGKFSKAVRGIYDELWDWMEKHKVKDAFAYGELFRRALLDAALKARSRISDPKLFCQERLTRLAAAVKAVESAAAQSAG